MSFMRTPPGAQFAGSRFETTYSSSYSKPYMLHQQFKKPSYMSENVSSSESNKLTKPTIIEPKPITKSPQIKESCNRTSKIIETAQKELVHHDYNHMVTQIARISENLYLSGIQAITAERLKTLGITLIVSLVVEVSQLRLPSNIQQVQVNIEDMESANLRRHFDRVLERINLEEKRNGKILVHCVAGVSRSATIIIAYLMKYHNMRLRDAYNHTLTERPYIQPNLGFWKQLIDYERSLYGSNSVNMVPSENGRLLIPDVKPSMLAQVLSTTPMYRYQLQPSRHISSSPYYNRI